MEETHVFINCPFSTDYTENFWAITYAILRSGLKPRCAREADNAGVNRYTKICDIIRECRYGIHDISYTEAYGDPPLPRFNMPFELGLFLGAHQFGGRKQTGKMTLVLDIQPFRFQKFLSDIAGQDICTYDGRPLSLIEQVATWLRIALPDGNAPGGRAMATEYEEFRALLPVLCASRQLQPDEITFHDFQRLVAAWIEVQDLV